MRTFFMVAMLLWSLMFFAAHAAQATYVDNGNTVTDTVTGLEWQKATAGPMNWQGALAYAEGLTLVGKSDWRLPDINELHSLTDYSSTSSGIDPVFAATLSVYWSSTTSCNVGTNALGVGYSSNITFAGWPTVIPKSNSCYVRAVRGGQSGSLRDLVISTTGAGAGTVTSNQAYPYNTSVILTATPAFGSTFTNWSGDADCSDGIVTMTTNVSCVATFVLNSYTLTYAAGTNGSITGTSPQTVDHAGNGTAVTAVPATNYHFVKWSDDSTSNPRTDSNVTADSSVTATFAINTYTLAYTAGTNGSITGASPQTVDHGGSGTPVTAVPATGYHFVNWSDNSTSNPRTDSNMTADISVTATFTLNTYTLTYTAGSNGNIIGDSPQTVNYGASGTLVTAVPAANYHFVKWSDDSTTNPRTDSNVTADISVTATFAINAYTLAYTAGTNGSITGTTPQTVANGGSGTVIVAVPAIGYHFVHWSDNSISNLRTDSNVIADISVTATFALNTYTLTYTAGTNGSIIGMIPQIVNHGASGTAVTAVPATNYHFVKWSDDSSGNPRTDSNVATDITVTAIFSKKFQWPMFLPAITGAGQK